MTKSVMSKSEANQIGYQTFFQYKIPFEEVLIHIRLEVCIPTDLITLISSHKITKKVKVKVILTDFCNA